MSDELYTTLTDDAQESINRTIKKIINAQELLSKSSHPGVRLSNREAGKIIVMLRKANEAIDLLPASLDGS